MHCSVCGAPMRGGDRACPVCASPNLGSQTPGEGPALGERSPAASYVKADLHPSTFWFLLFALAVVAVVLTCHIGPENDPVGSVGYCIGSVFFLPAIIVAIARVLGARRWRINFLIASTIFLGISATAGWNFAQPPSSGMAVMAAPAGTTPAAQDVLNELRGPLADYVKLRDSEHATLAGLNFKTLLTPETLTSASGIADSKSRVSRYYELEMQRIEAFYALADRYNQRAASLSESDRNRLARQLPWFGPDAIADMHRLADERKEYRDTAIALLDLAQANLGQSSIVDGRLILPPDASRTAASLFGALMSTAAKGHGIEADLDRIQKAKL